ncbi:hypothetical protein PPERSA_09547 [Pseudocohnilembus persalinus]|uniref:Uncharacterized protein n=1 Tax=Pseudocohnilembus persalinus TaxID=266149 RepID=A0A0V0QFG4_PSEPJ|nr:hypothetical protein PPERSA_09547 [Pseudocohnilembus persalinus]|eukprot:KRX00941.1 hypothetical protein PPERSA_09547 [Pseudocohnilembus persalinus]
MNKLPIFICLLLVLQSIQSFKLQDTYPSCPGQETQTSSRSVTPRIIQQSSHGKLYQATSGNNYIDILVLFGDAKQMGTSAGSLLKQQVQSNIENFESWVENNLETVLEQIHVPKFLADMLGQYSVLMVENLLDLLATVTAPYTPQRFTNELKGMASGANISYKSLRNFNLFGELFQGAGASALAGVWGEATSDGELYTLRTLDWPVSTPLNQNPIITIYQSTEENSYSFANIGYSGIIGAVTLVSSQGISIGDKVWFMDKDGESAGWSYIGTPYQYALRDLAQFGKNLEDVHEILEQTKRTVKLYVGVGSTQSNGYEGFKYSKSVLNSYNDKNYSQIYTESHPQQNGVFYWNQYTQPSKNSCFSDILQENYGKINAQTLWQTIPGYANTGISQLVVADLAKSVVYVAYGADKKPAYNQDLFKIDLSPYW